jgi:hypothetical protein
MVAHLIDIDYDPPWRSGATTNCGVVVVFCPVVDIQLSDPNICKKCMEKHQLYGASKTFVVLK